MACRGFNTSAGKECSHCGKAQVIRLSFSDVVNQVFEDEKSKEQDISTFEGTLKNLGILEVDDD